MKLWLRTREIDSSMASIPTRSDRRNYLEVERDLRARSCRHSAPGGRHPPFNIILLAALALYSLFSSHALAAVQAVPTFHSLGLYWSDSGGSKETVCEVRYRKAGTTPWRSGYPLWFDARSGVGAGTDAERPANEYRGSLVQLDPGTTYEIELSLRGTDKKESLRATTWSENFHIAKTITLPPASNETLVLTESGSPSGYILYTGAAGTKATLDVAGAHEFNVHIKASHVIVRGLTLKNAGRDAIRIEDGQHDIVIEECDISGWGRIDTDAGAGGKGSELWGMNGDAGVYSNSKTVSRVIIQRNRFHDPRTDTNNWSEERKKYDSFHPRGPQAIYLIDTAGHLVIRYNDFFSDGDHRFNDVVAGNANFSWRGFPHRDSDIYANKISHCWDDGIEAEGGNCNVRIWGNYLTECYTGIATAATSVGPIYIFRNVYDRRAQMEGSRSDYSPFAKLGDNHPRFGGGRRYFFHNTLLQQPPPAGSTSPHSLGASGALSGSTSERPMVDVVSRNNIWHLNRPDRTAYTSGHPATRDNDIDYDLTNGGAPRLYGTTNRIGSHMIKGTPKYLLGDGPESGAGGRYALDNSSPGFDAGEILPNFNDGFYGAGPDVGAHEAGTPHLEFGIDAHRHKVTRTTHVYKRVGTLEIKADVYRWDDDVARPVVISIHGGALISGSRDRISKQMHQLVGDGAIVVSIDYRLAPETKLPGIIEDLEDAFKWVREQGPKLFHADPNRIGVWGNSAGGYLTLTAGFRVNPRPQVLVSLYGYGDLIGDWYSKPSPHPRHHTSKKTEAEVRAEVSGPPLANPSERKRDGGAFYQWCRQNGLWPKEVSGWDPAREAQKFFPFMAVKNVTPQYPPTLLLHGNTDTDVPFEQSVMMAAELKKHGVEHRLIELPGGEHGFDGADPKLIEAAYQTAIAFTKKHLGIK
jgi:acetyl esterase/lipase